MGYWARVLHDQGVDVVAFDIAPPPSSDNPWFAGQRPWFPVKAADERIVAGYSERTLLLVWPTRNEGWGADAAELHLEGAGSGSSTWERPPAGEPATTGCMPCSTWPAVA